MTVSRDSFKSYFTNNPVSQEFFEQMVGDHIGTGSFRSVFSLRHDTNFVIKFESAMETFHNVREWEVWKAAKGTPHQKWFAPCDSISFGGSVLIQRYVADVVDTELPTQIPAFFQDCAPRNWGKFRKNIVCRDYGNTTLLQKGMTEEMRDPNWRLHATKVKM